MPLRRSADLFFFNDTATTEIYTLSLHDALPILERIDADIRSKSETKQRRQERAERYRTLAQALELPAAEDSETFVSNHNHLGNLQARQQNRDDELQNQQTEAGAQLINLKDKHNILNIELTSLHSRRSSINERQIRIRQLLCDDLNLAEEDMPFAGELIQVSEDESEWEGAAERLLHNFALSLLVPDKYYREVADWVNHTHLKARLVYFRVHLDRSEEHTSELQSH